MRKGIDTVSYLLTLITIHQTQIYKSFVQIKTTDIKLKGFI